MTIEATPAKVRPNDGLGVCRPERASECGLTECRNKAMCERCALAAGAKLKPCPWCWTEGASLFDLWDSFDAGHVAHVHCTHCGADGPSVYSEQGADSAIKQARHRWNSRMVASSKTPNAELTVAPNDLLGGWPRSERIDA